MLTCFPAKNNLIHSSLILNFSSTSFLNTSIPVVLDVGIVIDLPVSIILTCTYMANRFRVYDNIQNESQMYDDIQTCGKWKTTRQWNYKTIEYAYGKCRTQTDFIPFSPLMVSCQQWSTVTVIVVELQNFRNSSKTLTVRTTHEYNANDDGRSCTVNE